MKAIYKRELRALMRGVRGWGYVTVMMLCAAVALLTNNLLTGSAQFEMSAMYIALGLIPATALASADGYQAEKRQRTERLLYALPIRNIDVALGKLLAHLAPVVVSAVGLCLFPLVLQLFGPVNLTAAYASILAIFWLGVACMAVGLCVSVCVNGRATAFATTAALLALSWAAPYLAAYIGAMGSVHWLLLIVVMALSFILCWCFSGSVAVSTALTAVVEIPMLLAYLKGDGAGVLNALAAVVREISLFDGLTPFINGLLDIGVLIKWAVVAALMVFIMLLYLGNRRQATRRAL